MIVNECSYRNRSQKISPSHRAEIYVMYMMGSVQTQFYLRNDMYFMYVIHIYK